MPVGFDEVKICNMALGNIGVGDRIEKLGENSPEGSASKLWFDPARLATLEAFNWDFARKSQVLALHGEDAPLNRWQYRYQLPADCVAAREIENPYGPSADAVPYEIEMAADGTKSLVTDQAEAVLIYTFDQKNIALFSMQFTLAMAFQLAVFFCYELAGKFGVVDRMQRQFNALISSATNNNAQSSVPKQERDAPWIRGR